MHAQVTFSKEQYEQLWIRIIKYKINNQARVLNILGELGSDIVAKYGALSPTGKWGTKKEYSLFRKMLQSDGYIKLANEVYMRVVQNRKCSEKHYRRMEECAPKTGTVRIIRLTEKQYKNIYMLTGEDDFQEKMVGDKCHIVI